MLPDNELKFHPPFKSLQNEEEVISASGTVMQKQVVTKSKAESEKDRRENVHYWNLWCVIFFIHTSSTLLNNSRKEELGE